MTSDLPSQSKETNMETMERSYTHMDKASWGPGPWQDEPDKMQWVDEATGFDCLIVRNRSGALCGYVGVPNDHPCHGAGYNSIRVPGNEYSYADVHGGLTYADSCDEDAPEDRGICHVPLQGRPADVWWLGFDCAHYMDVAPGLLAREREMDFLPPAPTGYGESYRTVDYVRSECASLARQLVTATVAEDDDE